MTKSQIAKVKEMLSSGLGYAAIAEQLDISVNTIKSYCKRHQLKRQTAITPMHTHNCLQCSQAVPQALHRKEKKFSAPTDAA